MTDYILKTGHEFQRLEDREALLYFYRSKKYYPHKLSTISYKWTYKMFYIIV